MASLPLPFHPPLHLSMPGSTPLPPPQTPNPPGRTPVGFRHTLVAMGQVFIHDKQPSPWGHAALSGLIVVVAASLYGISYYSIQRLSAQWEVCPQSQPLLLTEPDAQPPTSAPAAGQLRSPLRPFLGEPMQRPLPDLHHVLARIDALDQSQDPTVQRPTVSNDQEERLKTQLLQFQRAQQTACQIGVFFFAHRNATLTVATAAAILALASLAIVSKEGWTQTNNVIINLGLTSGLVLFTAITYSQLYGQGSNFENQKAKVILATNALNSIASAVANRADADLVKDSDASGISKPRNISLTKAEDMAALIHALDRQLEVLVNLDFSGDSSFAEQSAKRISDMLNGPNKLTPAQP
jgi:hypothetical protein